MDKVAPDYRPGEITRLRSLRFVIAVSTLDSKKIKMLLPIIFFVRFTFFTLFIVLFCPLLYRRAEGLSGLWDGSVESFTLPRNLEVDSLATP